MSISIIPGLEGPDEVPRSVVELTPIRETESHRHLKAQLLYVITAEADGGTWTVRPHCAIWIPRGVSRIAGMVWPITVGNPYFEPTLVAHFVTNAVSCSSSRCFANSWPFHPRAVALPARRYTRRASRLRPARRIAGSTAGVATISAVIFLSV